MPPIPKTLEEFAEHVRTEGQIRAMAAGEVKFVGPPRGPPPQVTTPVLPETLEFATGPIDFRQAPLKGSANLVLYRNGNYEFWGHLDNLGSFLSFDAGGAWVIVASDGTAFVFGRKEHLSGLVEDPPGPGPLDWDFSGNNTQIADKWAAIAGGFHSRWQALATATTTEESEWATLVQQVQDALKATGTIIQTVVTVVALF